MESVNLSRLKDISLAHRMTPDELLAFATNRKRCFDLLTAKHDELAKHPPDTLVIISENGNYTLGKDVFEACDSFAESYPDDHGKKDPPQTLSADHRTVFSAVPKTDVRPLAAESLWQASASVSRVALDRGCIFLETDAGQTVFLPYGTLIRDYKGPHIIKKGDRVTCMIFNQLNGHGLRAKKILSVESRI
jgi:hypothetical protein